VSVHVNVSGGYRHVPRNSATQTTNVLLEACFGL